jgi:hypothetical protein
MKCTRVEKFLPLHITGDLAERRTRAVERHLAACEKCRITADEYRTTRAMFCTPALSPDFDGAFYEEIRNSVLARIRHDRTLAPPSRFSTVFNPRLVYAASLSLIVAAAALALHSYTRRTPGDDATARMDAIVERERPTSAPATIMSPRTIAAENDDRATAHPPNERARVTKGRARREQRPNRLLPPQPVPDADIENALHAPPPNLNSTSRMPSIAGVDPPAPSVAATGRANAEEINAVAGDSRGTNAQPEVSRIEIQTSDPDIRIIWLTPKGEDPAHPLR